MLFDILGSFFSLLSTYYFIRLNNKAWPIGLVATGINGWLYWHKAIYADMGLEFLYFLSMIYGWYCWHQRIHTPSDQKIVRMNDLRIQQWVQLFIALSVVFLVIYYLLSTHTNSNIAELDAITTTLSLIAQILMSHKVILTWIFWFITDSVYVFIYSSKDLPVHSVLMLVYTSLAIVGYFKWYSVLADSKSKAAK